MKILLGDLISKVGREDIFKSSIENESLHKIKNDNGVISENLTVKSTMFPYCNIHKYAWTSPYGKTHNQIDHILIDRQMYFMFDHLGQQIVILTTIWWWQKLGRD
jgi:hypothetical protein